MMTRHETNRESTLPTPCGLLLVGFLVGASLLGRRRSRPIAARAGVPQPPDTTRPWCYWYWISDNISKEGHHPRSGSHGPRGHRRGADRQRLLRRHPGGRFKVLSEPWWELVEHAIREGGRVGVNIAMFNCPGWSQSGGPWIKPEQAMRYLVSSETRVHGPVAFQQQLPVPQEPFQDVAVLAFPAPAGRCRYAGAHARRK